MRRFAYIHQLLIQCGRSSTATVWWATKHNLFSERGTKWRSWNKCLATSENVALLLHQLHRLHRHLLKVSVRGKRVVFSLLSQILSPGRFPAEHDVKWILRAAAPSAAERPGRWDMTLDSSGVIWRGLALALCPKLQNGGGWTCKV